MTPEGDAGQRIRAATTYLRRAMDRLPPASGRQLVGRALTELEALEEGESEVGWMQMYGGRWRLSARASDLRWYVLGLDV